MFKENDRVWDMRYGWGTVVSITEEDLYPVVVKFEHSIVRKYFKDGRWDKTDRNRILFFQEISVPQEALERPRWRAEKNREYFFVNGCGAIVTGCELFCVKDGLKFEVGNYFQTEEEAKGSKFYKVFHEEEE